VLELEAELAACQAKLAQAQAASLASSSPFDSPSGTRCGPVLPPRSDMLARRNTISLGHLVDQQQGSGPSRHSLRLSVGHAQAPQSPTRSALRRQSSFDAGAGALTLSRLSRMLGAYLLLGTTARSSFGVAGHLSAAESELLVRQESTYEGQDQARQQVLAGYSLGSLEAGPHSAWSLRPAFVDVVIRARAWPGTGAGAAGVSTG
jgi:hypothetical protein